MHFFLIKKKGKHVLKLFHRRSATTKSYEFFLNSKFYDTNIEITHSLWYSLWGIYGIKKISGLHFEKRFYAYFSQIQTDKS